MSPLSVQASSSGTLNGITTTVSAFLDGELVGVPDVRYRRNVSFAGSPLLPALTKSSSIQRSMLLNLLRFSLLSMTSFLKSVSDPAKCWRRRRPHFKTWRGHRCRLSRACDLVLLTVQRSSRAWAWTFTFTRSDVIWLTLTLLQSGLADVLEVESGSVLNGVLNAA
jgi:hypothetical protein